MSATLSSDTAVTYAGQSISSINTFADLSTVSSLDSSYYSTSVITYSQLTDFLKEDELTDLLNTVKERADHDDFYRIVRAIVSTRNFTEKFLMNFIDVLDKYTIFKMHKVQIQSGEYSQLALYFELNK